MLDEIKQLITKFGMACPNLNLDTKLGETDLGLDSQEIVEFTCMVEKQFNIKLPSVCFKKTTSIRDVIQRVQQEASKNETSDAFEGRIEASLEMDCTAKEAYRALYKMEKWPEKLPHVKHIETLYNDGVYQEFLMDVESETGLIQVRSIRRCQENEAITFFQPKPPVFLKHHCGGWTFHQVGSKCQVKTWHQWNLKKEKAQQLFPAQNNVTTQERVSNLLRSHAELALKSWKNALEAKQ